MTKRPQTSAAKRNKPARPQISLESARLLCPDDAIATNVAAAFALSVPDFSGIREAHDTLLRKTWTAFDEALNETATKMHYQRIVGTYVASAQGAGRFYSEKLTEARTLTAKLANEPRDEDRDAPAGFESKAQRARQFAADLAIQAYALLAAAEGAVQAYLEITGEDWKPYVAPSETENVERKSAAAELGAFG
ncbi:hypothetical protein CQW49_22495 (plasmid) [Methylosinus trichosporium OB3b]|uniref:Uncharacterized protein n=1 Tax=Methylosinus trichosporium (strain ATCC 35070 / NCIMB 11131 / UNIQEM 75 / OB3b) TaxID=595536 RepID=A0A2D2D6X8_METT3|nr:hypothetical protein [Methylosinus trichosporium]ATQ70758.1 hypothetical protein CQW49_22495 [Methylosinus trichosporium OB3b]